MWGLQCNSNLHVFTCRGRFVNRHHFYSFLSKSDADDFQNDPCNTPACLFVEKVLSYRSTAHRGDGHCLGVNYQPLLRK